MFNECTHINLYIWNNGEYCEFQDLKNFVKTKGNNYKIVKFPVELGLDMVDEWVADQIDTDNH